MIYNDHLELTNHRHQVVDGLDKDKDKDKDKELTNHRHQVVDRLDPLRSCEQVHDQIAQVAAVVPSHLRKKTMNKDKEKKEKR